MNSAWIVHCRCGVEFARPVAPGTLCLSCSEREVTGTAAADRVEPTARPKRAGNWTSGACASHHHRVARLAALREGRGGGPTPLGYRRSDGRLEPDPLTAPVIARIFTLYARHRSLYRVVRLLRADPAAAPLATWSAWRLSYLLQNRVYLGELRYREVIVRRAHRALVAPIVFSRVQKLLREALPWRSRSAPGGSPAGSPRPGPRPKVLA